MARYCARCWFDGDTLPIHPLTHNSMAAIKMTKQGSPVSLEQIEQFELRNGVVLPDSYKRFLLRDNGGEPMPDRLVVPGWHGQSTAVNRFFGLNDGGSYDLETSLRNVEDYVPTGF